MVHPKLRLQRTQLDNLVSNLRGEVGEIVTDWVLWQWLRARATALRTDDLSADLGNRDLNLLQILISRLEDDIVARLAELAEPKIGRLNFYFAAEKLKTLQKEAEAFQTFIAKEGFRDKRNQDISHKELPETWDDHKYRWIPYRTVIKGIVMALRLMKKVDRAALGPAAPFMWRNGRRKRYELMNPPRAMYGIIPHIRLSEAERLEIVIQELKEGRSVWSEMDTLIDGKPAKLLVSREWAILHLGDRLLALNEYPLQTLTSINSVPDDESSDPSTPGAG